VTDKSNGTRANRDHLHQHAGLCNDPDQRRPGHGLAHIPPKRQPQRADAGPGITVEPTGTPRPAVGSRQ
jgi:hypothetical protein